MQERSSGFGGVDGLFCGGFIFIWVNNYSRWLGTMCLADLLDIGECFWVRVKY